MVHHLSCRFTALVHQRVDLLLLTFERQMVTVQGLSPCQTLSLVGCSLCSAGVTPLHRSYGPIRHPLAFDRFPGLAGYTIYLAPVIFAPGRGGLRQLLGVSLSPCCRFHPAEVKVPHRSGFGTPCCLRPMEAGSAFGFTLFRGHIAFTVVTAR